MWEGEVEDFFLTENHLIPIMVVAKIKIKITATRGIRIATSSSAEDPPLDIVVVDVETE